MSDEIGMLAHPHATLDVTGDKALVEQICKLAVEFGVERLVVGLPLNGDGSLGPRAQRVEELCKRIEAATSLPVERIDERYSSQAAERALREAPKKIRRDKGSVDRLAAAVILQSYLDKRS